MSAFRDALAKDLKAVFFNPDEFAELHSIDGKKILCVVDKNETADDSPETVGVFSCKVKLYVKAIDMLAPAVGQFLRIDKQRYLVRSVKEQIGVLIVELEENLQ